jgi:hypothetical protein
MVHFKELSMTTIIDPIVVGSMNKIMPYRITFGKDRYHLNGEMEHWCKDNIGPGSWGGYFAGDVWSIDSMFGNTTFKFKEEKNYTWFVLRWS